MRWRMEKQDVIEFLNKNVKLNIKNGYMYRGKVLEINNFVLVIDDIRDGKTKISLFDITTISEQRW